jgi:predicted dehydrogenase
MMREEKRVKVGIVGNGNIYRLAHRECWQSINNAQVVATCDLVKEKAHNACSELAAELFTTDIDDLLREDSIDVIDICAPTYEHANLSIKALDKGKHVICEKPISNNLEDAHNMVRAAQANGTHLYIAHTRRFDERWINIKDIIASKEVGEPITITRSEKSWLPFPADHWYWNPCLSGGVLLDIGIHVVDQLNWFFNDVPIEIFAKGKKIRPEARENNVFDFSLLIVGYKEGKNGIVDVSWAYPRAWAPFYSTLTVIGSRGKLEYSDKESNPMTIIDGGIEHPRYSPLISTTLASFQREIGHFMDCIVNGTRPAITVEDAYAALVVIDAAQRSINESRPVQINSYGKEVN